MRKEVLWALLLAFILVAVLFAQRELKESIKNPDAMAELPFGEETLPDEQAGQPDSSIDELPSETITEEAPVESSSEAQPLPEALNNQLRTALESFHQKAAIRNSSSEELHHTPKVIRDAAEALAKIAETEAQNPQYAQSYRDFYLQCARDDEALTVIRAQCLEKYAQRSNWDEDTKAQLLSELPESVVRLYRAL